MRRSPFVIILIKKFIDRVPFSYQRSLKCLFLFLIVFFTSIVFFSLSTPSQISFSTPIQSFDLSQDSNSTIAFSPSDFKVSNLNRDVSLVKMASIYDSNSFVDPLGNCYLVGYTNSSLLFVAKFDIYGNLVFNSTFGNIGVGSISDFTVDNVGNTYLALFTRSSNISTKNAYNATYGGEGDVVVAKFNSTGGLIFSTYLGGSSYDESSDISVDSNGDSYVTGFTSSDDFPTVNAFNATYGGGDVFVTKFNATGGLIFSTYLGSFFGEYENDLVNDKIVVDSTGNSYVTGETDSLFFPTKNAYQLSFGGGFADTFVTKFNSTGGLIFSTYLGGSSSEFPNDIAVDSNGNSFITGYTLSTDFPTINAFNATFGGENDVFVIKLNATGQAIFSTFLGANEWKLSSNLGVDSIGNCYVAGTTNSTNFPIINAFNSTLSGGDDAFVTKFSPTGGIIFSTFLGGNSDDFASAIAVDIAGSIYVAGITSSTNFPTINAFNPVYSGGSDVFLTKFSFSGSLVYSTFFGGTSNEGSISLSVDSSGDSYIIGTTFSNNFPVVNAYQQTLVGSSSYFISKFTTQGGLIFSTYFGSSIDAADTSSRINQLTNSISSATQVFGNSVSSSPISNTNQLNILDNYSYLIFFGLVGFFGLFIVSIVEYINYKKNERSSKQKTNSSFLTYVKKTVTKRFKHEPVPPHLSNSTFELLDKIEKENSIDT